MKIPLFWNTEYRNKLKNAPVADYAYMAGKLYISANLKSEGSNEYE